MGRENMTHLNLSGETGSRLIGRHGMVVALRGSVVVDTSGEGDVLATIMVQAAVSWRWF